MGLTPITPPRVPHSTFRLPAGDYGILVRLKGFEVPEQWVREVAVTEAETVNKVSDFDPSADGAD